MDETQQGPFGQGGVTETLSKRNVAKKYLAVYGMAERRAGAGG